MELSYNQVYHMNPTEARKQMVHTYLQTGNISHTARVWNTSRQVVRKWVRRYQEQGDDGLADLPRRPHTSPRQTPAEVEQKVLEARKHTGFGTRRLAWHLWREQGIALSAHTIRHILRRHGVTTRRKKKRQVFYPAHWAWEEQRDYWLAQVDVKDILDKAALGTQLYERVKRLRLPRYQYTFCEARTRLRFVAYGFELHQSNVLLWVYLVMRWIRDFGIKELVVWQTDWGEEFGGDNPQKLSELQQRYFAPLGAQLARYPKGRKGYNGRVERSHRTDDEEFYVPLLGQIEDVPSLLAAASGWQAYYNLRRAHSGKGMEGKTPYEKLVELGYDVPEEFALFPVVLLDTVSTSWQLETGNDLLAHYEHG
ncbi:hypothetical protein HRbin16_01071 [bacterium HR16]|nr:hypothetical protein HRbin16_01071 [bacterium HR16]